MDLKTKSTLQGCFKKEKALVPQYLENPQLMIDQIKFIMVFKTDVQSQREAMLMSEILRQKFKGLQVNFDLQDEERILRTEGMIEATAIAYLVRRFGFSCRFLSFAEPIT